MYLTKLGTEGIVILPLNNLVIQKWFFCFLKYVGGVTILFKKVFEKLKFRIDKRPTRINRIGPMNERFVRINSEYIRNITVKLRPWPVKECFVKTLVESLLSSLVINMSKKLILL